MKYERSSGILLHPTSLPGPYGIGDLGPEAHRWVDFLAEVGCSLWQVLPLGPTGYGDSPYQPFSSFAGNPYLISPAALLAKGWLNPEDLQGYEILPEDRVDYGKVISWKMKVLDRATIRFQETATNQERTDFASFRREQAGWLEDYALYMALKEANGGAPWTNWKPALRERNPEALVQAHKDLAGVVERHVFWQYLFFNQWTKLREYAHQAGVRIIGDAPIFVAHDSADVWAHQDLFFLDKQGKPTVVAGVPPDYFSPTGQLWGNPLYRWKVHQEDGYRWWLDRLNAVLRMVDIIRLDHFRGFAGYWEIPAGLPTAQKGRWVSAPGEDFLTTVKKAVGDLPLIAEDLGEITADVIELREQFDLPGMKILQFAFDGGPDNEFLPHNYPHNCVVYTGTHDNDTTLGWFLSAPEKERQFCLRYLERDEDGIVWDMIRAIWSSVAMFAIAPVQDFLTLGTEARMNFPGRSSGNWTWRMPAEALDESLVERLKSYNYIYGRIPEKPNPEEEGRKA